MPRILRHPECAGGPASALPRETEPRWGRMAQSLPTLTSDVVRLGMRCYRRQVRRLETRRSYAGIRCLSLKVIPTAGRRNP